MVLKGKNKFRVIHPQSLNTDQQKSLAELYLPLMGQQPYALYHLLNAEGYFTNEINNRDNGIRILNDILNKLKESLGNNYNINIQEDGRTIDDISNIEDISTIEMAIKFK